MLPEWLETARYGLALLLWVFGVGCVLTNVASVVRMLIQRVHSSLIPFAGGLSLVCAALVFPVPMPRWLPWCFLLVDPGCSFYLLHGAKLVLKSASGARGD